MKTFRERYCERHGIDAGQFDRHLLRRSLHLRGRLGYAVRFLFGRDFFAPDWEFVQGVGGLRGMRDFDIELIDFHSHPGNQGLLRKRLKVRVSTSKMRRLVRQEFPTDRKSAESTAVG